MDLEFPKGMGDQVGKIMEIPGGRGSNAKPSGTENPVGWGVKLEKTLRGGYGYFLEPHNGSLPHFSQLHTIVLPLLLYEYQGS